jgi:general L-amino acid transport system substrate-binding protein
MLPGSTTEIASQEFASENKMKFTPVIITDGEELRKTFLAGRCDAYFNDLSAIAGFRSSQGDKAADFLILPELLDKEPLGAAVRKGDDQWFDIVRWTHFALVAAEEMGVSSANVDSFASTTNPPVRRLLGLEGDFGSALGLDNRFMVAVIKGVGNFGEIWDRDVTPTGVARGLNALWSKGGLQYAPPIR